MTTNEHSHNKRFEFVSPEFGIFFLSQDERSAGEVIGEVVLSIRTVVSFNAQELVSAISLRNSLVG